MARFYSNENFPLPVVEKLRALPDFNRQGERIHKVVSDQASLAGQLLRVNRA